MKECLFVGFVAAIMVGCGWVMQAMLDSGDYTLVCSPRMFDEDRCILLPSE